MARRGRPVEGAGWTRRLEGSRRARERVAALLRHVRGEWTAEEAGRKLGIGKAQFYRMQGEALQGLVDLFEPKPKGRPRKPAEPEEVRVLRERVEELERELRREQARADLNQDLRNLAAPRAAKGGLQRERPRRQRAGGASSRPR